MELVSKIKDDCANVVHVQVTAENGVAVKKTVTMEQYLQLLAESAEAEKDMIEIGHLPKGFFSGKVHPYEKGTLSAIICIPKGLYPVNYMGTEYTIPFPGLAFSFLTDKGRLTQSCVAAYKGDPAEDSELFYYPFGNVYEHQGICWGRNQLPDCGSFSDLDIVVSMFFGSETNNDLYSTDRLLDPPDYTTNLRAFYEALKGKEMFPEELLKPIGTTIGQLMN